MKKSSFVVLLLVGATILGATVLREPIAWAAQSVEATITNVDANGNIKVHEQGTADVRISNSATDAVVVRDPEVGHQPWHMFMGTGDEYVVPDGKRLVIEFVNGIAQLVSGGQADWTLSISGSGPQGYHFLGQPLPGCTNCYVLSQELRLYAPAGSVVTPGFVPVGSELRLSGYLIDL